MYCKNCGKKINDDAKFCPYCGTNLNGENTPVAAYVVKDPNSGFVTAQKVVKHSLALAILITIGLVINILFWTIMLSVGQSSGAEEGLIIVYSIWVTGVGIAEWVIFIIILTKWKIIKNYTSFNHLWFTIGMPITIGCGMIFLILSTALGGGATIVFLILDFVCEAVMMGICYYGHFKMKKTLHR